MPWLALLKRPKILTIIALVVGGGAYIGWQHIKVANLRADVAELQGSIDRKDNQIKSMIGSIKRQNDAVDEWKAKAADRAALAHKAMQEAQNYKQQADEVVGRIQASEAMTCQEGIELINRELWP